MGAWEAGSFDNDDANDWLSELSEAEDTSILEEAFLRVIERDGYLEAPDCSAAVAAAEVVAAMKGAPAPELPEEVTSWMVRQRQRDVSTESLGLLGLQALDRIKTDSELKELWEEEDPQEWYASIADLEGRLRR